MKQVKSTFPYAFVTFLMLNDSYLPGALMLAYALRKQKTNADLVCLVTGEITLEEVCRVTQDYVQTNTGLTERVDS